MHYKALDGLRGIAAYTVVISHFSGPTNFLDRLLGYGAGHVGVYLFFSLSGFLMGRLYFDKEWSPAVVAGFFQRRFARVVPLYLIIVLASYALPGLLDVDNTNLWKHLVFLEGTAVLWTVAVEVKFYLAFPLFWLAYRRFGNELLVWLVIGVVVLQLVGGGDVSLMRSAPAFLVGMAASMVQVRQTSTFDYAFVGLLALYIISLPQVRKVAFGLHDMQVWQHLWLGSVYPLLLPLIILVAAHSRLAETMLGNRVMRFSGDISYSVYLLHLPIFRALKDLPAMAETAVLLPTTLALVTIAATASFLVIERPSRAAINRLRLPPWLSRASPTFFSPPIKATSDHPHSPSGSGSAP